MGLFNSASWTGGDVADAVTLPKPPVESTRVSPKAVQPARDGFLTEYAELAQIVGVHSPDLSIETFKDFLRAKDWGIFSLSEVISYMDKKAASESKEKSGWEWRPLREKDHMLNARFGTKAIREYNRMMNSVVTTPASDYYIGPQEVDERDSRIRRVTADAEQSPYNKTIPLHALRKVAQIEKDLKTVPVSFFVCDYALAPQIQHPDPFLMAAINNTRLNIGVGRFIIDFWDEPGFGIDRMIK